MKKLWNKSRVFELFCNDSRFFREFHQFSLFISTYWVKRQSDISTTQFKPGLHQLGFKVFVWLNNDESYISLFKIK